MNRCRLCVIPDTRPDTPFVDGICSACVSFAKRPVIDWQARALEFDELMAQAITGSDPFPFAYDCIVASSGGKDSHWQVLKMLELGYKPLIVTATTCMLTPIGRANIDNLGRFAPTIEVTPDRTVRAKLNRLGLELVGDISWPEHATIFNAPWQIAAATGIPIVIYGENPQEAYGGPPGTDQARQMTRAWVNEFGGFLGLRARDLIGQRELSEYDMNPYQPLDAREVEERGIQAIFLGSYFEWDSERNAAVALGHGMQQALPWKSNWWDAENLDNAMTGLHDHFCYRKYGYGRAASQLSVDIRWGRLTRERALDVVQVRDGLFPYQYGGVPLRRILERIEMTEHYLEKIMHRFTNWDLFAGESDNRPTLKEFA